MNIRMVIYLLGCVLNVEGVALLVPFVIGMIFGEKQAFSFLITAGICFFVGILLIIKKPKNTKIYAREGFVTVALSWIIMSAMGALPFVLNSDIPSYVSAFFETVSGFTTTGSTILTDIESLSHASLFWRAETHWLGGLGIIVFLLGIVRLSGGYSMQLLKAESPGPSTDKFMPRLRYTSIILYAIYTVLTGIEFVLLMIFKMPWFDAITTAFATAGTGGFSVKNASIAAYGSPGVEIIITVFMVLFGINFAAYFLLIRGEFKAVLKNEEIRTFLIIIVVSASLITLNIRNIYPGIGEAIRHSFFSVGSIISTTGFITQDFDLWPTFSKMILVILMFIGACAGSTGGGMKVSRIIVLFKAGVKEIQHLIHPKSITTIKLDGKKVSSEMIKGILAYFTVEMIVISVSTLIVSLNGFDTTTTVTSVITCIHNVGPGLNMVGPVGNFASFSVLSKIVLSFNMLVGRLEIMPMLILFSPATWKRD